MANNRTSGWALVFRGAGAAPLYICHATHTSKPSATSLEREKKLTYLGQAHCIHRSGQRFVNPPFSVATTKLSNPSIAALIDQDNFRLDIVPVYACFMKIGKRDGQLSRPLPSSTHWSVVGFLWEDSRRQ